MREFARIAGSYISARPAYPPQLFDYLAGLTPDHDLAWDCATGNGQAAVALAGRYRRVVATDVSPEQVARGVQHDAVRYLAATAERSGLRSHTADLVTVATAVHWFNLESFYAEARRVLKPGGVLAVWGYHLCRIATEIDDVLRNFYRLVEPHFPAGFHYLSEGYRTLPFPETDLTPPAFTMETRWDLDALIAFIQTWSGVRRFADAHHDPIPELVADLRPLWGDAASTRKVTWDLMLRVARL